MGLPVFDCDNVSKGFGNKLVFDSLSFVVGRGDKLLFHGPSGIGKTTLFHLLMGFGQPDAGLIRYQGQLMTPEIAKQLRREVAFVPQQPDLGQDTVRELIREIMSFQSNNHITDWPQQLDGLLHHFELARECLSKDFQAISGGEKQRIAIIMALLLRRQIILLDEPTSALDPALAKKVIRYFSEREDLTLLVISHDLTWTGGGDFRTINLST